MKKRILSLAVMLVIIFALVPKITAAPEVSPSTVQPDSFLAAIEPPIEGSTPISNRAELAAIAKNVKGTYHLVADIDLSDGAWVPITGEYYTEFSGTLDGQGHIIRNLTIPNASHSSGLFSEITASAIVKNVGLEGLTINGSNYHSGGICGVNYGSISNCYNTGTISARSRYIGGICGINYGSIDNCYNFGSMHGSGDSKNIGGICGENAGSISNCYNMGTISISDTRHGVNDNSYFAGYMGSICGYGADNSPAAVPGEIKVKGMSFDTMICTSTLYSYIDKGILLSPLQQLGARFK